MQADAILGQANSELQARAAFRDNFAERSMERTVATFNALTGRGLQEIDGWVFMCCLKLARSQNGVPKLDDFVDLAAYAALAGETLPEP